LRGRYTDVAMQEIEPVRLLAEPAIEVLDQTLLPHEERYLVLRDLDAVCEAIRALRVRGAPLLGVTGACGMVVGAGTRGADDASLGHIAAALKATRPTAVDLGTVVDRAHRAALAAGPDHAARLTALRAFAETFIETRKREDRAIAALGAELLSVGSAVLTHCNTGTLATGGVGTALGVIGAAWETGRLARCYATETRPLLQGARLTMWELQRRGIPATLLPDTAAASLIASGRVQAVITGADRVAANGDTANKIGTYGLAAVAARHGVPFYVAAPLTTVDASCADGSSIPIEHRAAAEVGGFAGSRWAPAGVDAYNPAFDVTPAELIAAIVTELAVLRPPYAESIMALIRQR